MAAEKIDIQIDMTAVQNMLCAYQTALWSFAKEWGQAYPDQIENGERFLNSLVETFGLPSGAFDKAKSCLRGEVGDEPGTVEG